MKKFLVFLSAIFICTIAIAHSIEWYVDDSLYQTTTCSSGNNVTPPIAPAKYGYTFDGWDGYKSLEYIESTGTQYISLDYYANPNTKIYIDFALSDLSQKDKFIIFGGWAPFCFGIHYSPYTFAECSYDDGPSNDLVRSNTTASLGRQRVILDAKNHVESWPGVTFNTKTTKNQTVAGLPTTYTSNQRFLLFGTKNKLSNIKLYEFKLWDNGTLIYDMKPAVDIHGSPCMFDTISKECYYNQGTGAFIAGPEVGSL